MAELFLKSPTANPKERSREENPKVEGKSEHKRERIIKNSKGTRIVRSLRVCGELQLQVMPLVRLLDDCSFFLFGRESFGVSVTIR